MLSATELAEYQALCEYTLTHTYTRTVISSGSDDDWNMAAQSAGTVTTGVACNFLSAGSELVKPNGTVIKTEEPTITVKASDSLSIGYKVTDIKDSNGTVVLAGPVYVQHIDNAMGFGPIIVKVATLQGTKPVQW